VYVRLGVSAGVGEDEDLVVAVVCVANGRENNAARDDPGEDQRRDVCGPAVGVEVSVEKAPTRVLRTMMSPGSGAT